MRYFIVLLALLFFTGLFTVGATLPATELMLTITASPHPTVEDPMSIQLIFTSAYHYPDAMDKIVPDDLQTAADILLERLEALQISDAKITITEDYSLNVEIEVPASQDIILILDELRPQRLLEFVDFSDVPQTQIGAYLGMTILTDTPRLLPPIDGATATPTPTSPASPTLLNPTTDDPFHTAFTGDIILNAEAQFSEQSQTWLIAFELTEDGGQAFGDYTEAHIGDGLAIVLDGVVLSIPTIQSRLDKGGVIQGEFTQEEAELLAAQLNAGALPFPLTLVSIVYADNP